MTEAIKPTDYFEKGFKAIEGQRNPSPEAMKAVAKMRAIMWSAEAEGAFDGTLIFDSETPPIYTHPDFEFNLETGEVIRGSSTIQLRPAESILLAELSRRPNRLVTRERLAVRLWGDEFVEQDVQSVRVHISLLRDKLAGRSKVKRRKKTGADQSIIKTVRDSGMGKGYMLVDPSRHEPAAQLSESA